MYKRILSSLFLSLVFSAVALADSGAFSVSPTRGISSWLLYEMKPGDVMEDSVVLRNQDIKVQTYKLFAVDEQAKDASDKSEGFSLVNSDSEQKSIGKWVIISEKMVTLQPGENRKVSFSLKLPSDVTKEITYSGAIVMAAIAGTANNEVPTDSKNLSIATQVGLRMYVKATDNPQLTETTQPAPDVIRNVSNENNTNETPILPYILAGAGIIIIVLTYKLMKKS